MVSLKNLSNFRRTREMLLTNCEISLVLTWSKKCFLIADTLENQNYQLLSTIRKSQIPVATGGFELRISRIHSSYLTH